MYTYNLWCVIVCKIILKSGKTPYKIDQSITFALCLVDKCKRVRTFCPIVKWSQTLSLHDKIWNEYYKIITASRSQPLWCNCKSSDFFCEGEYFIYKVTGYCFSIKSLAYCHVSSPLATCRGFSVPSLLATSSGTIVCKIIVVTQVQA